MSTSSKTKKNSKDNSKDLDLGWCESGIDITKSLRLKLFKLFGVGKKKHGLASPLGWFMGPNEIDEVELANKWTKQVFAAEKKNNNNVLKLSAEVFQRIDELEDADTPGDAIVALAASHCLRAFAGSSEFDGWNLLVEDLLEIARKAEADVDADPTVYQMLAVELPLAVAFQVPELEDYQELAKRTCRKLELALTDMLDHDGWPLDCYLENFGTLVASWARSNLMLKKLDCEVRADVAAQLEWLIRQTIRLMRPDGTLMYSVENSNPVCDSFVEAWGKLSSDPMDAKLIKGRFTKDAKKKRKSGKKKRPSTSNFSEWAGAFVLQADWGRKPKKIAVDYSKKRLRTEVCSRVNLFRGNAFPEITSDGKLLHPETDFEIVSDLSDANVEYVELEMELSDGSVLCRQHLLSRTESFLMIADSVVSKSESNWVYKSRYPLGPGITVFGETENRELYLCSPKIEGLVLPVGLPEWKVAKSKDSLKNIDNEICLEQHGQGFGLYAPLFIDLDPKRSRKKRTWRQLTVSEGRKAVSRDVACAFRVQLDKQQWVFYRSIARRGNRTFMGENFSGEFVFIRFEKDGSVTEMINVDD